MGFIDYLKNMFWSSFQPRKIIKPAERELQKSRQYRDRNKKGRP